MRVYISADMEGVNGVVLKEHVDPEKKEYVMAREWMIQEVNAAVAGAVAGGASQVVVNDAHNNNANLPLDRLHPKARLCCGPMKPFSMMQEIDSSFDAVFLIGYHAMYAAANAVLDHIFAYSMFTRVEINGMAVGEFGLNAGLAGYYGAPVTLVTGDQAVVAEASALIPDITAVIVKEGRGRYSALCYPFQETCAAIGKTAAQAVRNRKKIKPLFFQEPLQLTVTYQRAESADLGALLPDSFRLDSRTVRCQAAHYPELYRKFLALFRLARA
jgi:D-amino peptidase